MLATHRSAILKYDDIREKARDIAHSNLPSHLKKLELSKVDAKAVTNFRLWEDDPERKVDWDWSFAARYTKRYPKAFDLSVWSGNKLLSLTLGRPTYKGTSMRMDFIERSPKHRLYASELFPISLVAYETYASLIGAEFIRIMNPMNDKLISYYTSKDGGFRLTPTKKGNSQYLVKAV